MVIETSPEMRYVGALLDKQAHDIAAASVPPEALGDHRASALYAAILAVAGKRSDVRAEDVIAELEEHGKLDEVGGADKVSTLAALHADEPVDTVRREVLREASRRAAQEAGRRLASLAKGGRLGDAVSGLQEALQAVQRFDGADVEDPLTHAADHLERLAIRLDAIRKGEIVPGPIANLGPFSRPLGQPRPGTLIVVGGFSHAGKSFLMQFLEREYHLAGYPTLRLSLEDADPVTEARVLAEVAGFDLSSPFPDAHEASEAQRFLLGALKPACGLDRSTPRLIVTPRSKDLAHILRTMRRAVAEYGVRVVFVDYAQEVDVPDASDAREKVARAVSAIKLEAIRLGIAVFLGSQLRKPPANVKNYEPTPHDLKDASELHHASEVLILCFKRTRKIMGSYRSDRIAKICKDKLTGSYPEVIMRSGVGGVVDALVKFEREDVGGGDSAEAFRD